MLRKKYVCDFDEKGSIGKRYRRHRDRDTLLHHIDYQTLKDDTVTLRKQDSMEQVRIKAGEIEGRLGYVKT